VGRTLRVVALLAATFAPLGAQTVHVEVVEAGTARPLQGVLVVLVDAAGVQGARDLTDTRGRATLAGVAPGEYTLRADLIGYGTETRAVTVAAGEPRTVSLTLETGAIELEGFSVEAEGRCEVRPDGNLTLGQVWSEIRKALEAARLTQERNAYQYRTRSYTRTIEGESGRVAEQNARFGSAYQTTPFESRPVDELLERGFVQDGDDQPGGEMYYAPDAVVLVSDPFLDSHCMRLTRGDDENAGLIGVEFEPVENRRVPDIAGTLWVDPETWLLSHLEYRYVHTRPDVDTHDIGGEVVFQRLPDGTWIVPEWRIRTPWLALGRDGRGRESIYQFGYHDIGATVVSVRSAVPAGGRKGSSKPCGVGPTGVRSRPLSTFAAARQANGLSGSPAAAHRHERPASSSRPWRERATPRWKRAAVARGPRRTRAKARSARSSSPRDRRWSPSSYQMRCCQARLSRGPRSPAGASARSPSSTRRASPVRPR